MSVKQEKAVQSTAFSVLKKSFQHAEASFSALEKCKKLMIQNKRHPSRVSFVTIFLPIAHIFRVYRQSQRGILPLFSPFLSFPK